MACNPPAKEKKPNPFAKKGSKDDEKNKKGKKPNPFAKK